jgi:hypothetical protein
MLRETPEITSKRRPNPASGVRMRANPISVPQIINEDGWSKNHPTFEATKYIIEPFGAFD